MRVIDQDGGQLGIMELEKALQLSAERGLDLIQVTQKVEPPVCRIADYGKFLYWENKKKKLSKPQKGGEIKSVRLGLGISPHDMETRAKQAEKFLRKGHMVRIDMNLRGREKAMEGFAKEKIRIFLEGLAKLIPYKVEREIKKEMRGFSMLISHDIKHEGQHENKDQKSHNQTL